MSDQIDMESFVQDDSVPYAMASEPPLSFRGAGYDYDHEVLVTLPASYPVAPAGRTPYSGPWTARCSTCWSRLPTDSSTSTRPRSRSRHSFRHDALSGHPRRHG